VITSRAGEAQEALVQGKRKYLSCSCMGLRASKFIYEKEKRCISSSRRKKLGSKNSKT
jgi:hypothetical protein